MIIETSALIEVVLRGPLARRVRTAISQSTTRRAMSAANLVEAHIVVRRRLDGKVGAQASQRLDRFIAAFAIEIEPVTESAARRAIDAFARFGKGAGGGALNFGDCFAYALAMERKDELLFVGDDFSRTDVKVASL